MAIKARKRRSRHDRVAAPFAAPADDGSVCLVERVDEISVSDQFALGTFRITKFFDHGEGCGHDHGPPEIFGPFATRREATDYAQQNLGAEVFRKV